MTNLFKSIYTDMTIYSRDDSLCTSYGRVLSDGDAWQAVRRVGTGSSVITRHASRAEAETKLETGNAVTKQYTF